MMTGPHGSSVRYRGMPPHAPSRGVFHESLARLEHIRDRLRAEYERDLERGAVA
jgi:hypothetical protein